MTNKIDYSIQLKLFIVSFGEAIFIFFSPMFSVVFLVGCVTLIDTVFGIIAAKQRGSFTSRKLRTGFMPKLFGYNVAILLVFAIDHHILNSIVSSFMSVEYLSTKVTSLAFIVIEAKSIDENFKRIYNYSMLDKLRKIVKSFKTIKDQIKD